MLIEKMKPHECDELLAHLGSGRLACAHNNQPYIVPIYFAHTRNRLYAFATFGRKIEWMRSNPLVSVQADEVTGPDNWASVVVLGRYEELADTAENHETRIWAQSLLERRSSWWQVGYAASQVRSHPSTRPILYCIHVQELTGLRATPGEKLVEKWTLKS